jgi:hypothetical protein
VKSRVIREERKGAEDVGIMPYTLSPVPSYIIGGTGIIVGLWALLAPAAAAEQHGIPASTSHPKPASLSPSTTASATSSDKIHSAAQSVSTTSAATSVEPAPPSPYVGVTAFRDIAFGLAFIGMQMQDNVDGVSTLIAARGVQEVLDGMLIWRIGGETVRLKALGHLVGGVVMARWAWWRFFEAK